MSFISNNKMKIYQHYNTLLLQEGDSIKVIHHFSTYEFYEGTLKLDPDEDIVDFYFNPGKLVCYTTKKRIIACSLNRYIESEVGHEGAHNNISKVVKVNVESVIFGPDYLVYYDGTFNIICCEKVVDDIFRDVVYYLEEDLEFLELGIYQLVISSNSDRIMEVSVKNKDNSVERRYPAEEHYIRSYLRLVCPDQKYMLCDLGDGDYYVLTILWGRGLECHYLRTGGIKVTTENLLFSPHGEGCLTYVIHEEKMYRYSQEDRELSPLKTSIESITDSLKETNLTEGIILKQLPSFVYSGTPYTDSSEEITIYMVDTEEKGVFAESDTSQGTDDIYFINSRGRLWKACGDFTFIVDGEEVVIYTPHIIAGLQMELGHIQAYHLPTSPQPIKAIYDLGTCVLLFSDTGTVHGITLTPCGVTGKFSTFTFKMQEISFSRQKSKIDKDLIFYNSYENQSKVYCRVEEGNYLGELMTLCRYFSDEYCLGITIVEENYGDQIVKASGDGAKRFFIDKALKQFSDLYLTECGRWPFLRFSSAKASSITDFLAEDLRSSSAKASSITDFLAEDLRSSSAKASSITDFLAEDLRSSSAKASSTIDFLAKDLRSSSAKASSTTILLFKPKELCRLGATLSMMIDLMEGPLSIRLPLVIVEAIYSAAVVGEHQPFSIDDFEYFAKEQNPDVFSKLVKFKEDPEGFAALQTGHSSYEEAVKDICAYPVTSRLGEEIERGIKNAAYCIGAGFVKHRQVKNINEMNPQTLDYYLSGPYVTDRKMLCDRIKIVRTECDNVDFIKEKLREMIMNLSESELTQLLINWSGTSVMQTYYDVSVIDETDLNFKTCFCSVEIPSIYFSELHTNLKDLLVMPIGIMKD